MPGSSFNHTKLMETKPVTPIHNGTKQPVDSIPYVSLLLVPIFLIAWGIFVFTILADWKFTHQGKVTINPFKQVPCKNCRFFHNNPHLKCAVHPFNALTKQALNCPDYQQKSLTPINADGNEGE